MEQHLIFDLDSTLYPNANGYEENVRKRIFAFMHQKLGVEESRCESVWRELYAKAGQTLRALRMGGFEFDVNDYWDFIREGVEKFVKPDPALRELLMSLPQTKWVLTNAQEKHAEISLELIGIGDLFEAIMGSDFMGECCKPSKEAFAKALDRIGCPAAAATFFDDALVNVRAAKELGMKSVLVVSEEMVAEYRAKPDIWDSCDAVIGPVPTLANLQETMPHLFDHE